MRNAVAARHVLAVLTVVAAVGAGCGDPEHPVAEPITTTKGTWSWVDFPKSTCDEGTPTGIGANLTDSKNVVIFFNGGGACWDATTCLTLNTSTHGPFTATEFNGLFALGTAGSLFDRQLAKNPYKDWNMFFIPYCTGDLHIGANDAVYTSGSTTKTFHHQGRSNTEAFLARIAGTVRNPDQVLVTGVSAGGFGSTLNYALIRGYFPSAKVMLVDDSGPFLKTDAINPALRQSWSAAWKYDAALDAIDPAVKTDFSAIYPALARKYPNDRMALLSSQQDKTIRTYLGLSGGAFQTALTDLDTTVLAPLPLTRFFVTTGEAHTMLGSPASHTSNGVELLDWLGQMQTASPDAWKSVAP